jgi:hypothetical protein
LIKNDRRVFQEDRDNDHKKRYFSAPAKPMNDPATSGRGIKPTGGINSAQANTKRHFREVLLNYIQLILGEKTGEVFCFNPMGGLEFSQPKKEGSS